MKRIVLATLAFAPALAFAQSLGNLEVLLRSIGRLISIALPIVVALALLAFFWGLVKFIFGGEEKKAEGKHLMIWGIVALFIMVAVWGIVRFIGNALGVSPEATAPVVPTVPGL